MANAIVNQFAHIKGWVKNKVSKEKYSGFEESPDQAIYQGEYDDPPRNQSSFREETPSYTHNFEENNDTTSLSTPKFHKSHSSQSLTHTNSRRSSQQQQQFDPFNQNQSYSQQQQQQQQFDPFSQNQSSPSQRQQQNNTFTQNQSSITPPQRQQQYNTLTQSQSSITPPQRQQQYNSFTQSQSPITPPQRQQQFDPFSQSQSAPPQNQQQFDVFGQSPPQQNKVLFSVPPQTNNNYNNYSYNSNNNTGYSRATSAPNIQQYSNQTNPDDFLFFQPTTNQPAANPQPPQQTNYDPFIDLNKSNYEPPPKQPEPQTNTNPYDEYGDLVNFDLSQNPKMQYGKVGMHEKA